MWSNRLGRPISCGIIGKGGCPSIRGQPVRDEPSVKNLELGVADRFARVGGSQRGSGRRLKESVRRLAENQHQRVRSRV